MEDIKKTIQDLIRQKGTIRKIATDLGMDHANLLRSLRKDANPGIKTVQKIVNYLGYEIKLIKRKGVKS
jgi:DNA-binding phage protein